MNIEFQTRERINHKKNKGMNTMKQSRTKNTLKSCAKNVVKGAVIFIAVYVMVLLLNDAYIDMKHAIADAWMGR